MGLPIQTAPSYNCILPVSKKAVKYRPFLVKEQSFLLQAKEGNSTQEIFNAILQLVKSVTDGTVDAKKIPLADLEYLFLQIRAKSIGETTILPMPCQVSEECKGTTNIEIKLSDITVDTSEMLDDKIKLSESLMVELTPPIVDTIMSLDGLTDAETIKPIMRSCLIRLYDADDIYELSDYRDSEIDEFVESLTVEQFENVSQYFSAVPTLRHTVDYDCSICKESNTLTLEGLANFF
tara:strand:- start:226 stop:933 length:708 start_codon:yes stop_codon:yes gene_type:complete